MPSTDACQGSKEIRKHTGNTMEKWLRGFPTSFTKFTGPGKSLQKDLSTGFCGLLFLAQM